MQIQPFLEKIKKNQPCLITPFIENYFEWADKVGHEKPYFYGKWSLKWILCNIEEKKLTDGQWNVTIHHMLCELALLPNPEEIIQFNAIKLVAFRPWKQFLNNKKNKIDVHSLPVFYSGGFKFVENDTADNLTSMIFHRTNADGIIGVNPETHAAMVTFRVNSKINDNWVFTSALEHKLTNSEPGWKTYGYPPQMFINHGLESKTPTSFDLDSLRSVVSGLLEKDS